MTHKGKTFDGFEGAVPLFPSKYTATPNWVILAVFLVVLWF